MELHNQALKYLQQYTKRCLSCGEGQFAKLLGKVSKREDRLRRPTVIEEIFDSVEFETVHDIVEPGRGKEKYRFVHFHDSDRDR